MLPTCRCLECHRLIHSQRASFYQERMETEKADVSGGQEFRCLFFFFFFSLRCLCFSFRSFGGHSMILGASKYCKPRIFCVCFIFVYFVRGGFCTKTKCVLNFTASQRIHNRWRLYESYILWKVGGPQHMKKFLRLKYSGFAVVNVLACFIMHCELLICLFCLTVYVSTVDYDRRATLADSNAVTAAGVLYSLSWCFVPALCVRLRLTRLADTPRSSESHKLSIAVQVWCCKCSRLPVEHSSGEEYTSERYVQFMNGLLLPEFGWKRKGIEHGWSEQPIKPVHSR